MKKNWGLLILIGLLALPIVGLGLEQAVVDETKAKAAQGSAEAQFNFGLMYYLGHGVEQNYAEAVNWYRKAAEQGNADAQENLGWCYTYGNGVEQNDVLAYTWFALAAKQGNGLAKEKVKMLEKTLTPAQLAEARKRMPISRAKPRRKTPSYPKKAIHLF